MLLTLKNIGRIAEASVEMNGITVIAGENNTGKSRVGKVLFCIFNSFYKIDQQINAERSTVIGNILERAYSKTSQQMILDDFGYIAKNILKDRTRFINDQSALLEDVVQYFIEIDKNFKKYADIKSMEDVAAKIIEVLKISDQEIFKTVLQKKLNSEFNNQVSNIYFPNEDGLIELRIKNTTVRVTIKNNEVQQITNSLSLNTEVIYMDDPFALDDLNGYFYFDVNADNVHRLHLKKKLTKQGDSSVKNVLNEIITENKMKSIMEKMNTVCSGELILGQRMDYGYKRENSDAVLDVKNISTGLKTFVILKTLLKNGSLEENGTIVLDEPEIHLHPEWQLLFAELIVLIQKEYNMHILLNTHSPYFLNAIEVYSAKYQMADRCKYYMAENSQMKSSITDVTDHIERIYDKLARPIQRLENERYSG